MEKRYCYFVSQIDGNVCVYGIDYDGVNGQTWPEFMDEVFEEYPEVTTFHRSNFC